MKNKFVVLICLMFLVSGGVAFASSSATSTNEVVAGASIDDHSTNNTNSKNVVRALPIAGNTPFPQTNGFFTVPTPDSSFRSVKELIELMAGDDASSFKVSEGALEEMAKGGDVKVHLQILRGDKAVKRVGEKDNRWLTIAYHKPVVEDGKVVGVVKPNVTVTGMVDGEADDADTNSFQVLGKMGLKVIKDGNNIMVITNEGAHRMVKASGWGIGFYTVGSEISSGGGTAGLVGGGTGYAQNEVGSEDKPWCQGYVGIEK